MSSVFWQTVKQTELLGHGKGLTRKVSEYIATWTRRCYSNGIPDEVDDALSKSLRAPSYKAIALAILKNDHAMKSLGFAAGMPESYLAIKKIEKQKNEKQLELFNT